MNYRGYTITKTSGGYVATPLDGDHLEIHSRQDSRLRRAIDSLWDATSLIRKSSDLADDMVAPLWIREWLRNPTSRIYIDYAYPRGAC